MINKPQQEPADDFVQRAKARIERMRQATHELTEQLELPPEATYEVLAVLYQDLPSPPVAAETQSSATPLTRHAQYQLDLQGNAPGNEDAPKADQHSNGTQKLLGPFTTMLCIGLLIGSLIIMTRSVPTGKVIGVDSTADPSGIFLTTSGDVPRPDERRSKPLQTWSYLLDLPWISSRISLRSAEDTDENDMPGNLPAASPEDIACIGGSEDDPAPQQLRQYSYGPDHACKLSRVLYEPVQYGLVYNPTTYPSYHIITGSSHQQILTWHDTIYINIVLPQSILNMALDRHNGSVRWLYNYPRTYHDTASGYHAADTQVLARAA